MFDVAEVLGFDPNDPDFRRAQLLASNDRALLRALVAIRQERGITQREVGEKLGISQPSVAAFESHDANPTLATIRRYAHAVGALVQHRIARDEGQLLGTDGDDQWRTIRLDRDVQIHALRMEKDTTPTSPRLPFRFVNWTGASAKSTHTDLLLVG